MASCNDRDDDWITNQTLTPPVGEQGMASSSGPAVSTVVRRRKVLERIYRYRSLYIIVLLDVMYKVCIVHVKGLYQSLIFHRVGRIRIFHRRYLLYGQVPVLDCAIFILGRGKPPSAQ